MKKRYYVYMMTNWNDRVLYIGVTGNIERRVYEHKNGIVNGFTKEYRLHKLVYCECTNDVRAALQREKQLKGWRREKKNALVNSINPQWKDLMKVE